MSGSRAAANPVQAVITNTGINYIYSRADTIRSYILEEGLDPQLEGLLDMMLKSPESSEWMPEFVELIVLLYRLE